MPNHLKPQRLRQRQNRKSTAAELEAEPPRRRTPSLPKERTWNALTVAWWRDVWRSPMAPEYLKADEHGLIRLALLVDEFWRLPSTSLASEIRLQGQLYGLSPLDRTRLQWEAARGEEAERRRARPSPEQPAAGPDPTQDPRSVLRALA